MKNFLLNLLASFLGVFIAILIIFGISALVLGTFISGISAEDTPTVSNNSVLEINLNQAIPDRGKDRPDLVFAGNDFKLQEKKGLNHILTSIDHARDDDRIKGIYLKLGAVTPGFATLEEIRNKLQSFKQESGKFVIAYGNMLTEKGFYLASVADHIGINPTGAFEFNGFSSQQIFFKKALEKLGVNVQVFYVGKFKSATEPFRREDMSSSNREQVRSYLTSIEDHYLSTVGGALKLAPKTLDSLQGSFIFNPADAYKSQLVDSLMYDDEVTKLMRQEAGLVSDSAKPELNRISILKYYKALKGEGKLVEIGPDTMVAVVYMEGEIMGGKNSDGTIGSETYVKTFRKLREKKNVGAIVLRINSPGGSSLASEEMWREISLTAEKKPVVVSMGNVAASGGYYISMPADKIFAQTTTITGSIGIFGMWLDMGELMEEKLGITSDTVNTAPYADAGNIFRSLQEREREVIQDYVESGYRTFLQRVADGRNMDTARVHELAQGRVWTGEQALDKGLVDYLGGMDDAIDKAGELAGLKAYYTQDYPEQKDFFEKFSSMLSTSSDMEELMNSEEFRPFRDLYKNAERMVQSNDHLYHRMPYEISIK